MGLISVDDLSARIEEPDLVICDVRFHLGDHAQGRREYDSGHLPGARFVDLHTELAGGPGGGRHPLPTVESFVDLLGRLGVKGSSTVVAYDDAGGATASRLWWMLRSIGHTDAYVLDGGVSAWVAAGHPVTTEVPPHPTSLSYEPRGEFATSWTGTVDADEVGRSIAGGTTVIDARAAERFRGDAEPLDPRAGHVPGAVNHFHGDTVGADGTHLPAADLRARFGEVGARPIVYCGSGVTACHTLLALSEAGIDGARLYPGSWSEWSSDPARPAATGD